MFSIFIKRFSLFFKIVFFLSKENLTFDKLKYENHVINIVHRWSVVLYVAGLITHIVFALLDFIVVSPELFHDFLIYRILTVSTIVIVFFFIVYQNPSRFSIIYGYLLSIISSIMITKMTIDLGGFDTGYYAGINIVIIGVNMMLPWKYYHSVFNGLMMIFIYIIGNIMFPHEYEVRNLINNLYFISSTVITTVVISYFQSEYTKSEYILRQNLHLAKDALWGEMELAKMIQISLLPDKKEIKGYKIASVMIPANEVGGDYFDIIESTDGNLWVAIGDVSGHGVESGLIMMMAQTAVSCTIEAQNTLEPSKILINVNHNLYHNINRLKVERYMTLLLMLLQENEITFSGRHLDFMVYRNKDKIVEVISEKGIFMGLVEEVTKELKDAKIYIAKDDVILLYTDGITEAFSPEGKMYGHDRLKKLFQECVQETAERVVEIILADVYNFQKEQRDDISLLILRKT